MWTRLSIMLALVGLLSAGMGSSAIAAEEPYKVALSMTFFGNDWQTENMNSFLAESKTPPYDSRVEVEVFQAGADVQTHIQQM
jgi:ABC-type sugar transport system substrate-binding protein